MDEIFDGSDSEEDISLKTQNDYAKKYDQWREKEELYKLEQKYGENASKADQESSDSEESSDEPLEITEEVQRDFLKTLSLLKKKDPRIYNPDYKFFEEKTLKKDASTEKIETKSEPKKQVQSLADAFGASDDDSENEEIFKVEKKADLPENKEDKLKEFLTGKSEQLDGEHERDLEALKALWSDPKLNDGEAFLRDYILNKRYLDDQEDAEALSAKLRDDEDLEADEARVEEQRQFERAYNFRFEEPDQEYLKRYPRTMNVTRPKDDRRARKRAEVRARKEEELRRKMEEIGRLKALKLKEIQEKIARIKEVTGNQELAFKDEDIEGDFDPEDHDRRMRAIFDEQYYGTADTEKPEFPDLDEELEIENWDKYEEEAVVKQPGSEVHCEDEDFNMDADYDPVKKRTTLMEEIKETLGKKRRNRKKKSKLAEILATDKPKYDPREEDKRYSEYMEEYYRMDCEDVIAGDLHTRFKYREVVPNSYGLTVEEILLADDKDLNKWVSLKKAVKYRSEQVEHSEVRTYQLKALDPQLKQKLLPSLFKEIKDEPEILIPPEQNKKKKKKNKKKDPKTKVTNDDEAHPSYSKAEGKTELQQNGETVGDSKSKEKKKYKDANSVLENAHVEAPIETELVIEAEESKKKKKKKIKDKHTVIDDSLPNKTENVEIYNNQDNTAKTKKKKRTVESTGEIKINEGVSVDISKMEVVDISNKHKKRKNKNKDLAKGNVKSNKLKRKHATDSNNVLAKRKKFNKDKKIQHKSNVPDNPLSQLSDERLKAYGLNPKKYRGFLKYKKF